MNYASFDLITDCYVYASLIYIFGLFLFNLLFAFVSLVDDYRTAKAEVKTVSKSDFYEQVKELMNPIAEDGLKLEPTV